MTKADLKVLKHALSYNSQVAIIGVNHVRVTQVSSDLVEKVIRYVEGNLFDKDEDADNERPG